MSVAACFRGANSRRSFILRHRPSPLRMRHIIAILLQNEAGALTRVAGLFSTRGYNIESGDTDAVRGQVVRSGGRVLDPAVEGFIVELTASEAEVSRFVADLGRSAELLEVVRSGALGISRSARPLRARPAPADA